MYPYNPKHIKDNTKQVRFFFDYLIEQKKYQIATEKLEEFKSEINFYSEYKSKLENLIKKNET